MTESGSIPGPNYSNFTGGVRSGPYTDIDVKVPDKNGRGTIGGSMRLPSWANKLLGGAKIFWLAVGAAVCGAVSLALFPLTIAAVFFHAEKGGRE